MISCEDENHSPSITRNSEGSELEGTKDDDDDDEEEEDPDFCNDDWRHLLSTEHIPSTTCCRCYNHCRNQQK